MAYSLSTATSFQVLILGLHINYYWYTLPFLKWGEPHLLFPIPLAPSPGSFKGYSDILTALQQLPSIF